MIEILIITALLIYGSRQSISGPIKAKTAFRPVYVNGKPNKELIKAGYNRPGTYIIKVNGNIRYIGYSGTNVYKTLTRHFQDWSSSRQTRVTYPKASYVTARIIYTNTADQAAKLERALILKHNPEDNPNKYEKYQTQLEFSQPPILDSYLDAPTEDAPF